jgi:hypothetical protein
MSVYKKSENETSIDPRTWVSQTCAVPAHTPVLGVHCLTILTLPPTTDNGEVMGCEGVMAGASRGVCGAVGDVRIDWMGVGGCKLCLVCRWPCCC